MTSLWSKEGNRRVRCDIWCDFSWLWFLLPFVDGGAFRLFLQLGLSCYSWLGSTCRSWIVGRLRAPFGMMGQSRVFGIAELWGLWGGGVDSCPAEVGERLVMNVAIVWAANEDMQYVLLDSRHSTRLRPPQCHNDVMMSQVAFRWRLELTVTP